MRVSIIIVAHNEEQNIERAIKSANNQDYRNFEVIVVENGSFDTTLQIAKKFCKNVYALKEANYAKSRNFGAKKATGEILVFLDGDSVLPRRFISEVVKLREKDFLIGKARITPNNSKFRAKVICWILNKLKSRAWGNMFIDKKFYWSINGCNPDMKMPDEDLAMRAKKIVNITKTTEKVITDMENFERKGYFKNLVRWLFINPSRSLKKYKERYRSKGYVKH